MKRNFQFLFPNRCVFCREILTSEDFLCQACQEEAEVYYQWDKHSKAAYLFDTVHCFAYRGKVRQAILRYKFRHAKSYHIYFGQKMAQRFEDMIEWRPDVITYVPTGPFRMWRRGYNQSELLARDIGQIFSLPVENLLKKRWFVKRQSALSQNERKTKMIGKIRGIPGKNVAGKRILLIDDVFTTGSTVSECARILKNFGASEVYCITLAKTLK